MSHATTHRTESVNTHDLNVGDIVWSHGMRIRLDDRTVYPGHPDYPERGDVVVLHGTVLNAADVNPNIVPVGWRHSDSCDRHERGGHWNIQGNLLARWTREVR